jgi:hypothetical protein
MKARFRKRKIRALLAAAALTVPTLIAVTTVASPASAVCIGVNRPWEPYYTIYIDAKDYMGYEDLRPGYEGTCDGKSDYYGKVWADAGKGCIAIRYYDPNQTTQGTSCNSSGYAFAFWDPQHNSDALWRGCRPADEHCTYMFRNYGF